MLGDRQAARAAVSALDLVRSRFDGQRWADQFELLGGNAGIALGAARADDLDLAVLAVTPYLGAAEPTPGGVHWEVRAGVPAAAQAGTDRALQLRVVPRPGGRRPGLPAAGPGHRRPSLDRAGQPVLAHRHLLRPARAAAVRVLGQQWPLLRHGRGPGPGPRPADRTRGRVDVCERAGQRSHHPGYRRRRRSTLEQLRAPGQPGRGGPAHRMGHGQRRHHPGTAALRPHPGGPGSRLRHRLARPPTHPPARPPFPAVIPHRLLPRVSPGDDPGGPDKYQTAGGNSVRAVTLVEVHGDVQKGRPQ
jgi:hypothetical protein